MKHRPSALTSPAPCGAFLCLSASPCNGTAQAPPFDRAALARPALPFPQSAPPPPAWSNLGPYAAAARRPWHGNPLPRPFAARHRAAAPPDQSNRRAAGNREVTYKR